MNLSVVIPAFGEELRIGATIQRLRSELGPIEIVVVDDGSRDATATAAQEAGADTVIRLPTNTGKGAAVRAGALAATAAAVIFTDADLAYGPPQITRILTALEAGSDVAVGTRQTIAHGLRGVGHRAFHLVTRFVLARRLEDTQCGCKGFTRDAAQRIFAASRLDRFAFDVEVLWLAGHLGLSITEVPVEVDRAEGSTVRVSVDAVRMLRDLLRLRWWIARGAYDREVQR